MTDLQTEVKNLAGQAPRANPVTHPQIQQALTTQTDTLTSRLSKIEEAVAKLTATKPFCAQDPDVVKGKEAAVA